MNIRSRILASLVTFLALTLLSGCANGPDRVTQAPAPQTAPVVAEKKDSNKVKGKVKTVVGKSHTLSVQVGKELMVFKFNSDTKFKNAASYKDLHGDELISIEYKPAGSENIATMISKIVAELPKGTSLIKTEEVLALIQQADSGSYVMFDARPAGRYHQAHIPTSLSLPFSEMDKLAKEGKVSPLLPQDKNKLVVFYCGGPT